MKRTLLFWVWVCWSVTAISQVTISGHVTDEKNQPLWGANVYLQNTVMGTITNSGGIYTLRKLPPGHYILIVSYVGYQTSRLSFEASESKTFDVKLKPKDILADEVLVSGTRARPEIPVTYSNLVRKDIAEENLGQDIPYLIGNMPSVVVTSDAGTGIGYTSFRVRGTDISRINVTMNGIPLNDSESHGVWWVDLPDLASSVEDIQLQRGVGTSTNGAGAFGATLNIQTFTLQKDPYAEISSSAGSFNTLKNTLRFGTGLLSDHFTFDGRFSSISSDGYIERASAGLSSMAFSGAYYGKKKDILRIILLSGKEKTYQSWDGVPAEMLDINRRYNGMGAYTDENGTTRYYDNETDNYRQDHLQLFYSRAFSPVVRFNFAAHYTHGTGYYEQYKQNESLSDYLLPDVVFSGDTVRRTDLIRQKWLDNDFYGTVFNLNMKKNIFNLDFGGGWNRYNGDHFGKVIWARYFSTGEKGHEWYKNTGIKTDGNVYAKASIRINESLFSYIDLQYRGIHYEMAGPDDDQRDISQLHYFRFFNPKAGLKYFFPSGTALYGSVAIAHREPSRYNFKDAPAGGPAPKPESLQDIEIGGKTNLGSATLSANLYYMNYNNQLVFTGQINDVGIPIMSNVPKSYRLGVEIVSRIQMTKRFSWEANATISRNKILNFTQYIDDWDTWVQRSSFLGTTDISFSPDLVAKSLFEYRLSQGIKIRWTSVYISRQYIDNASARERSLNPYWLNNLALQAEIKIKNVRFVRFQARVNNVFNAIYESNAWTYPYYENGELKTMSGFYPQAERNFIFGISIGI